MIQPPISLADSVGATLRHAAPLRFVARLAAAALARLPLAARVPAMALGGTAMLLLAALLLWFVFVRPRALQTEAARARIDAAASAASAGAATQAISLKIDHDREITRINTITKEGEHAVQSASGAQAQSLDVARALRAAVCLSAAHRADPACGALRRDNQRIENAGANTRGQPARQ